jgi:PmbA protein
MAARKTSSRRPGKRRAKPAKPKGKTAVEKKAAKRKGKAAPAPKRETAVGKGKSAAKAGTRAQRRAAKKKAAAKAKRPPTGRVGVGKIAAKKAAQKAKPAPKARPSASAKGKPALGPATPAPRRLPNGRRAPQGREAAGRKAMHRPAPREAAAPRPVPKAKAKASAKAPVRPSPRRAGEADDLNLLADLLLRARRAGADAADALLVRGTSLSQGVRLGSPEKLERAEGQDLGLRVLVGKRQAVVSTSDFASELLNELVERAVAMAKSVPEDPFIGLADPAEIAHGWAALDMADPVEPDPVWLLEAARAAEEAARAVKGVTNSEGAEASWARSQIALVASNGFAGGYAVSRYSVGVSVLAGEGTAMERDDDFTSAVYRADLKDPALVGRNAGERAVRRLNPRKAGTAKLPVLFEARVANSLVGHLAGAINGAAIARGTSFLKDKMNARILPEGVDVIDDPLRRRGLRSRPFDGEGIAGRARKLVEDGVLASWILDLRSARQLGLKSTGHGARGTSSPPSPAATNLYLAPGKKSPAELMAEIERGLYVTDLLGFGVNGVTGDYSRGAAGFWIEKGQIAYPVSEITIAGNLKDMYLALEAANDLEFKYGTNAPTVRIDGMTLAGK